MSTAIAARTRPTSRTLPILLNVVIATMTAGCEAIGTIFKAGVWTGVIAVVVVIGLVAFVAMKVGR